MSFESESGDRAEFNMAVSYLNRLNTLFSSCDQASISLDPYLWFNSLLAIYRELSIWISSDDQQIQNKRILQINPMIQHIYQRYKRSGNIEISPELYMDLHNWEIELREIANKAGLMMKMADSALDALR